jgi:hypothetical protein
MASSNKGGWHGHCLLPGTDCAHGDHSANERKFWFSKRHMIIGKPYYPTVSDPAVTKSLLRNCRLLPKS